MDGKRFAKDLTELQHYNLNKSRSVVGRAFGLAIMREIEEKFLVDMCNGNIIDLVDKITREFLGRSRILDNMLGHKDYQLNKPLDCYVTRKMPDSYYLNDSSEFVVMMIDSISSEVVDVKNFITKCQSFYVVTIRDKFKCLAKDSEGHYFSVYEYRERVIQFEPSNRPELLEISSVAELQLFIKKKLG